MSINDWFPRSVARIADGWRAGPVTLTHPHQPLSTPIFSPSLPLHTLPHPTLSLAMMKCGNLHPLPIDGLWLGTRHPLLKWPADLSRVESVLNSTRGILVDAPLLYISVGWSAGTTHWPALNKLHSAKHQVLVEYSLSYFMENSAQKVIKYGIQAEQEPAYLSVIKSCVNRKHQHPPKKKT